MRLSITDEQAMLVDAVRQTLARHAPADEARRWLLSDTFQEFQTVLDRDGWSLVGLAEQLGGQGGGFSDTALMAEEFGRANSPSGVWAASVLAFPALESDGELAALGSHARAAAVWAIDASDPSFARLQDVRVLPGPFPRLQGHVRKVLAGAHAENLLVPAVGPDGLFIYVINADGPGVSIETRPMLDRSHPIANVTLNETAARPLSLPDPRAALRRVWLMAAVLTASDALGCAQRMLEMTVEYVKQREQFGVPVGTFQAVQHAAAQMRVDITPVEPVVRYAAWAVETGEPEAALYASIAKTHATETSVRVADSALLLHGAIGFTWEHDLQLYYKRAKLARELFGATSHWRSRTAQELALAPAVNERA